MHMLLQPDSMGSARTESAGGMTLEGMEDRHLDTSLPQQYRAERRAACAAAAL